MSVLLLAIVVTIVTTYIIVSFIDNHMKFQPKEPEIETPCHVVDDHDEILLVFDEEEAEFLAEDEEDEERDKE